MRTALLIIALAVFGCKKEEKAPEVYRLMTFHSVSKSHKAIDTAGHWYWVHTRPSIYDNNSLDLLSSGQVSMKDSVVAPDTAAAVLYYGKSFKAGETIHLYSETIRSAKMVITDMDGKFIESKSYGNGYPGKVNAFYTFK